MKFADMKAADWRAPALALFYGTTCGPCDRLKPVLRAMAADHGIRLEEFNVTSESDAARELGLRAVPTVVKVHKGECTILWTGNQTRQAIQDKLGRAGML